MSEFLKTHSRDRELRHEKEPKQIRRERDSKVFRCVLREWLRKKNARIIHQQIDGPKVLDNTTRLAVSGKLISPSTSLICCVSANVRAEVIRRELATTR